MTDILTLILEHSALVVGVAAAVTLLMTVLAAIAWGMLGAEHRRHRDSEDRAARLGETSTSMQREMGVPLHKIEDSLRYADQKTDDIVATVTAFQRLYAANRDFTVTPELLFELKDLTKSVDSRELIVDLPDRIRQALQQLSMLSAVTDMEQRDAKRPDKQRVVAEAAGVAERDDGALDVGGAMMKTRAT